MIAPIDFYYWATPNGWKIAIFLEESGLPYNLIPVNINEGEQFEPDFLSISPNNKIPAILDPDGSDGRPVSVFESGAILIYLAEKIGRFLPADFRRRVQTLEWLMFQVGNVGPFLGQAHHFRAYAPERIPYAIDRYTNEAARQYNVMEERLDGREYFIDQYTIADMAIFPWVTSHERQGQDLNDYPSLRRWYESMKQRPAVRRALDLLKDHVVTTEMSAKAFETLFGRNQLERRR